MMNSDFELRDSTNPRLESESESFPDGSTSEKRLESESVNLIALSDVAIDSGNVSDVNNRRAEDSKNLGVFEFHEKEVVVSDRNHASVKKLKTEKKKKKKKGQARIDLKSKESTSPVYDSMISMFDDYAANGSVGSGEDRSSREVTPDHGFEVGDMVWAKVKSHPWWPGHVYSEQFATPSVRRSKREGLLFVAFFGDSSYGWFDPSELVPFDSNFAEKRRQTNSKTFVKAVEEATDEVSRRSALGLSCMCRSKDNFRQTNVEGYFAVDVADYEPGAVYSIDAIVKARDGFQPSSALDFVRQLALEPSVSKYAGIDFIKNKANLISYRRAVYVEFDETYAQAFGYDPVRPLPGSHQEAPLRKAQSKAPLSGRQVFADTSRKGKSCTKPNKSKDYVKKDKYLIKRRNELKEVIKVNQKEKGKVTSFPQIEDDVAIPAGDYVLQKRDSTTHEQVGITNANDELPSRDASMEDTPIVGDPDDDDDKRIVSQMDDKSSSDKNVVTQIGIPHSKPKKKIASQKVDNGPQKVKVTKPPIGELGPTEKKKKRKKEELGSTEKKKKSKKEELGVPLVEKEKVSAKKPHQLAALAPNPPPVEEDPRGSDNNKPTISHTSGAQDVSNYETELLRVLGDLHSLALDPFNTTASINKGRIGKTRKAFLKFRSLVFQKSLSLSAPSAEDEGNDSKSCEKLKQGNSSGRPDDPTKDGRKRGPSDRQEEIAAKKKKKVGDIRNLIKEKKVIKKIDEQPPSARDVKQQPAAMSLKKSGPQLVGKREPTMLNIKFQQGGNLPSLSELKATFVRYGAMDLSATRIFWNTCTCRVVYRHKANAQSAYRFVVGSSSLFGNTDVKCTLKEVGGDSEQPLVKDHHNHQPAMEDRPPKSILKKSGSEEAAAGNNGGKGRVRFMLGETQMENKNKNGESSFSSTTTNATMDFNSKNFQKAVLQSSNPLPPLLPLPNSNAVTNSSSSSSSNAQFTRPPPPPPPPPSSMHYGTTRLAPPALLPPPPGKFVHNLQRPNIGPPLTPKADISQQMLSLMTKCNEVVTNVTNIFGYVPYHPI